MPEQEKAKKPYYVLGIDPGISSCGFALLDTANHEICEMGSHLFDAPQNPKSKTSLAAERRGHRSIRRNIKRTRDRLSACLELLKEEGLVPQDADKAWFQTKKGDKPVLTLRVKALDHKLNNREWAQVLYSLCVRRGYIPHGESKEEAEGKVLSALKTNREAMEEKHARTIGEYLNTLPRSRNKSDDYSHCVAHSEIREEIEKLFEAQRRYGNDHANLDFENDYLEIFSWLKDQTEFERATYNKVGSCTYFPEERRAPKASFYNEVCSAYEKLTHIRIRMANPTCEANSNHVQGTKYLQLIENEKITKVRDKEYRHAAKAALTAEGRNYFMSILFSPEANARSAKCKVKYSLIRKECKLSDQDLFVGIDKDKEKTEIYAPKGWRALGDSLSKSLMEKFLNNPEQANKVISCVTYAACKDTLQKALKDINESLDTPWSDEELAELYNLPYGSKIFSGYGSRGYKALGLLIDQFDDDNILSLYDAEKASGLDQYKHKEKERTTYLAPYNEYDPTNNNPVVLRSLGRMRHIINAIIKDYGVPNEIHIELGRELKRSKKEKMAINKANNQNAKANEIACKDIAQHKGCRPEDISGKLLLKYRLWQEQDNCDLYTGQSIELDRLINDDTYCQIDHILPYSRTAIDTRHNKILCLSKSNQDKKEQTPYEWMTSEAKDAPNWNEFVVRVNSNTKLSAKKKAYCLEQDLETKEAKFLERNLNDDRYMSRAVMNYVADSLEFPEEETHFDEHTKRHVFSVAGQATSMLRRSWGLNYGKNNEKDREDDRHHAVDACVIAACNQSLVKQIASFSSKTKTEERAKFNAANEGKTSLTNEEKLAAWKKHWHDISDAHLTKNQPWPDFAQQVKEKREQIVPTRMKDYGGTGGLYEETAYKLISLPETKGKASIASYKRTDLGREEVTKKTGNFKVLEDGKTVRLVDAMAYLNIWFDPTLGKKGRYVAEPVYYADFADMKQRIYIPRYSVAASSRNLWPEISNQAKHILRLYRNDLISINGRIARYIGFNAHRAALLFKDPISGVEFESKEKAFGKKLLAMPSLTKWEEGQVKLLSEDILGHIYQDREIAAALERNYETVDDSIE